MTRPIRVQESSDETDLFIGEISPPMLPKTLVVVDLKFLVGPGLDQKKDKHQKIPEHRTSLPSSIL